MTDDPDITAGIHFCHTCRKPTQWYGTRIQVCEVCATRFPCSRLNCTHSDCLRARARFGDTDWTDLFDGVE